MSGSAQANEETLLFINVKFTLPLSDGRIVTAVSLSFQIDSVSSFPLGSEQLHHIVLIKV